MYCKTKLFQFVALLVSVSASMSVLGQGQSCFYEYSLKTQEQQIIQVNSEYPVENLTDIELAYVRPQLVNLVHHYCFDDQLKLTNTTTYENTYDSDEWVTPIGKTVVTETAIRMYDFEGNLMRETLRNEDPDSVYSFSLESLDQFGMYPALNYPESQEIQDMQNSGIEVYELGEGRLYLFEEGAETIIDYNQHTIINNSLVENIIQEQRIQYFLPIGEDKTLLQKTVDYSYKVFPSGAIFRIENTKINFEHIINGAPVIPEGNQESQSANNDQYNTNQNFTAFSSADLKSEFRFSVIPNPSSNEVAINVPSLGQFDDARIDILDVAGKSLYSSNVATNNIHVISLAAFSSGHYHVRLMVGDEVLSTPFVVIK